MRITTMTVAAVLALAAATTARGQDYENRLADGIAAHNRAAAGDASTLDAALRLLGPEGWERPPLALAYHGSALTLKAQASKAAGKAMEALSYIDSGAKEMDSAVALSPGDTGIRILRLENSLALMESSPVKRTAQVIEDLAALEAALGSLGPELAAIVHLDRGRLALTEKRLSQALASWRTAARLAPDSDAAARARLLLRRYGD